MFQKSFVVYTPARTGSTLIIGNLNRYFNADVLHNHNSNFVPPHENYTCILSKRKNIFESVLSHLVLKQTGEANSYTNTKNEPFIADTTSFRALYKAHLDFYKSIDLTPYKQVIEIYYEPLVEDPYYLFKQFNIVEQTSYDWDKKSPYNYYKLITNIDEIMQIAKNEGWIE